SRACRYCRKPCNASCYLGFFSQTPHVITQTFPKITQIGLCVWDKWDKTYAQGPVYNWPGLSTAIDTNRNQTRSKPGLCTDLGNVLNSFRQYWDKFSTGYEQVSWDNAPFVWEKLQPYVT